MLLSKPVLVSAAAHTHSSSLTAGSAKNNCSVVLALLELADSSSRQPVHSLAQCRPRDHHRKDCLHPAHMDLMLRTEAVWPIAEAFDHSTVAVALRMKKFDCMPW